MQMDMQSELGMRVSKDTARAPGVTTYMNLTANFLPFLKLLFTSQDALP